MSIFGETVRTPDGQLGTVAQIERGDTIEMRRRGAGNTIVRGVQAHAVILESGEVRFYVPEALTVLPGPL